MRIRNKLRIPGESDKIKEEAKDASSFFIRVNHVSFFIDRVKVYEKL